MEEQPPTFNLQDCGPLASEAVSAVLLVSDRTLEESELNKRMVDFIAAMGYKTTLLILSDQGWPSIQRFTAEFGQLTAEIKKTKSHVMVMVHYANRETKDMCMYCSEVSWKPSLILKQAFAALYVALGRRQCLLVCPERCCNSAPGHLPRAQIEGMLVEVDNFQSAPSSTVMNDNNTASSTGGMVLVSQGVETEKLDPVLEEIQTRLNTLRQIASHKKETEHVRAAATDPSGPAGPETVDGQARSAETQAPKEPDPPLTEDALMKLLSKTLDATKLGPDFSRQVGITRLEYEEYLKRSGTQTLYLVVRRCILTLGAPVAFGQFSTALETLRKSTDKVDVETNEVLADLAQLCRRWAHCCTLQGSENLLIFLAEHPVLETYLAKVDAWVNAGQQQSSGPWKQGAQRLAPEDGTHLDQIKKELIPPYMRGIVDGFDHILPEDMLTIKKQYAEAAKRAQELDEEYEKRKLAKEISDSSHLMGSFAMRDRLLGKSAGGSCPM